MCGLAPALGRRLLGCQLSGGRPVLCSRAAVTSTASASVLLWAMTSMGLRTRVTTLAIVKVLPEPVTPSKVWNRSPCRMPADSGSLALG